MGRIEPSVGCAEARIFEPRPSIAQTAEWMTKLRAAVGHGPVLGVEYHHRLSVAEAASFCQKMPPGTLDFLEEPIRDETPEACACTPCSHLGVLRLNAPLSGWLVFESLRVRNDHGLNVHHC